MAVVAQALFPDHEGTIQLHGQRDKGSKLGIDVGKGAGAEGYIPSPRSRAGSIRSHDPASAPPSPSREDVRNLPPVPSKASGATLPIARQLHLLEPEASDSATMNGSLTSEAANGHAALSNGHAALGNGYPSTQTPRPRAKSAQVVEPSDWHAVSAANGTARSASLAMPPSVPPKSLVPHTVASDRSIPPHVPTTAVPSSRQASQSFGVPHSTSVSSNLSAATSNSSHLQHSQRALPAAPHTTPHPGTSGCFNTATDPDGVAALVQQLYARLDDQGVYGDGWDEGKERSRDGIILRLDPTRDLPPPSSPRNAHAAQNAAIPNDPDLVAKADSVLRKVDRYGFFSNSHPAAVACQHHRLATLSSAPFNIIPNLSSSSRRQSKVPPPSSTGAQSADRTSYQPEMPRLTHRASASSLLPSTAISPEKIALETKRIDKWAAMLSVARRDSGGNAQDWTVNPSWWNGRVPVGGGGQSGKYRKLQRRVFKGVPDRWRRAVWGLMMEKMAGEIALQSRTRVPSLAELEVEYEHLVQQPYVQDVQIDLDVPRTISGHVLFHTRYGQGQRALFHVLHAFGLRSEDIGGYCQGMGPIAATLLCYFEPERAYAGLARLFDQYRLSHIFAPGFPGLHETFYVQEKLVELLMPNVHAAFAAQMISTSAYGTKWYITLFANSVPFATQLRLWDGLLLEGLDFLILTAVAIIWHFQHDFTSPSASFESILSRLSSYFFVESDDALLRWIRKTLRLKGLREKMKAWRGEWQGFVRDGTSESRMT